MMRRFPPRLPLLGSLLILSLLPTPVAPVAAQAASVTVAAYRCPPAIDPTATDPSVFSAACATPVDDLVFLLTSGDIPRRRKTANGQPATWPGAGGPTTIRLEGAPPGASVVFCDVGNGPRPQPVTDSTIAFDGVPATGLSCVWYLIPPSATPAPPPPSTSTPTSPPSPTETPTPAQPPAATVTSGTSIVSLGNLGGDSCADFVGPAALNDNGQVVGECDTINQPVRAFVWSSGKMSEIGESGTTFVSGINNHGQLVGACGSRACVWTDGVPTIIGDLGGGYSGGAAINDAGQVAGSSSTAGGSDEHAFLWADGSMVDLGTLGGTASQGLAINAGGQVVGWSTTAPGQYLAQPGSHAYLWSDGTMTDLGTLGGPASYAAAINDDGTVVGTSSMTDEDFATTAPPQGHAFVWQNGQMTDLGTLPGDAFSDASGINNLGQIVGASRAADYSSRAVMWDNGTIIDLNDLLPPNSNWRLDSATDINNAGQIVGIGVFKHKPRAFLLSLSGGPIVTPTVGPASTVAPTAETETALPRELSLGADRYLQDRLVPLDLSSLVAVPASGDAKLYARTAQAPYDAVYAIPIRPEDAGFLMRYLPEQLATPNQPCPAEATSQFAPAGIDLPLDDKTTLHYVFAG